MEYTVTNTYEIKGKTSHRTVEAALKSAARREGEGWQVVDSDGHIWTSGFDNDPIMLY
jgi:hypothetical protein